MCWSLALSVNEVIGLSSTRWRSLLSGSFVAILWLRWLDQILAFVKCLTKVLSVWQLSPMKGGMHLHSANCLTGSYSHLPPFWQFNPASPQEITKSISLVRPDKLSETTFNSIMSTILTCVYPLLVIMNTCIDPRVSFLRANITMWYDANHCQNTIIIANQGTARITLTWIFTAIGNMLLMVVYRCFVMMGQSCTNLIVL